MKFLKSFVLSLAVIAALQPMQSQGMSYFTKKNATIAASTALLGTAAYLGANKLYAKSLHWNWETIDPTTVTITWGQFGYEHDRKEPWKQITVPEFFQIYRTYLANLQDQTPSQNEWLWGTATAAHQVEADCNNNQWHAWEGQILDGNMVEPAGIGCDSWNHEDEDIQNMLSLGVDTYRFSVEWSKIFPTPDTVDREVLAHYKQFCKKLKAAGIKPVITLYHYTEPLWFYELGSFEKVANIKYFVEFCTTVFKELHEDVYAWFTFNAPEGIAFGGWQSGMKPPAKHSLPLAAQVFKNILEAHVQMYQACKALPGGAQSRIGILKNILQLDPWNIANPLDHLYCKLGNYVQSDSLYRFFTTGQFKIYIPGVVNIYHSNPAAPSALDFIGLNYYCHNYVSNFKRFREPNPAIEIHTNHPGNTIYGEGLYRAIEELSNRLAKPLGIPIYVTENGIGTDNDEHRILQSQRYLYAMARAILAGHDVRGYIHWSLMDNYEWGTYKKHFGLYHIDRSTPALKRTKKPGAAYFEWVVKGSKGIPEQQPTPAPIQHEEAGQPAVMVQAKL